MDPQAIAADVSTYLYRIHTTHWVQSEFFVVSWQWISVLIDHRSLTSYNGSSLDGHNHYI